MYCKFAENKHFRDDITIIMIKADFSSRLRKF